MLKTRKSVLGQNPFRPDFIKTANLQQNKTIAPCDGKPNTGALLSMEKRRGAVYDRCSKY